MIGSNPPSTLCGGNWFIEHGIIHLLSVDCSVCPNPSLSFAPDRHAMDDAGTVTLVHLHSGGVLQVTALNLVWASLNHRFDLGRRPFAWSWSSGCGTCTTLRWTDLGGINPALEPHQRLDRHEPPAAPGRNGCTLGAWALTCWRETPILRWGRQLKSQLVNNQPCQQSSSSRLLSGPEPALASPVAVMSVGASYSTRTLQKWLPGTTQTLWSV